MLECLEEQIFSRCHVEVGSFLSNFTQHSLFQPLPGVAVPLCNETLATFFHIVGKLKIHQTVLSSLNKYVYSLHKLVRFVNSCVSLVLTSWSSLWGPSRKL
jgi:hypothetical protein